MTEHITINKTTDFAGVFNIHTGAIASTTLEEKKDESFGVGVIITKDIYKHNF